MPVQISWIIAEDYKDKFTMYKVFIFNTVEIEENHVLKIGSLTGWQPPATGNIPSFTIAVNMHMHLAEKNTCLIKPLTIIKTLTPYLNIFIDSVIPSVGDGNDTWIDFTSSVAGFNANEWILFNP